VTAQGLAIVEVDHQTPEPVHHSRPRRRWPIAIAVLVVAVLAATAGMIATGAFRAPEEPASTPQPGALATVEQRDVSARQQVSGEFGYAGAIDLINNAAGTVTALPDVGQVLGQGEVLYRVDGAPVVLLSGTTPVWREFAWGTTGPDVQQLNAALVALGYADGLRLDPASDKVTWTTQRAVQNLQAALGLSKTGVLTAGQVVFAPSPLRVTGVDATLGAPAGPGQVMLTASSTTAQVTADVRVDLARAIEPGDAVVVTLPDQTTVGGTVQAVGTIATKPDSGAATVSVVIALDDPAAANDLDQAPVLVSITTASVEDALVVPVTALLALAGSGYAVEVADDAGTRLIPVELGLFDSDGGVVQVTGTGLAAGQRVVVPST
jgi:peptidoglycan hydrolase-like protein with peptidoglycan-binding domain